MSFAISKTGAVALFVSPVVLGIILLTIIQPLWFEEIQVKNYFNHWDDSPYNRSSFNCRHMSILVEEYWETVQGYSCYLAYGKKYTSNGNLSLHMWTIVEIDSVFYEFESTSLVFKSVSDEYDIHDVSHGFYVDGVKFEKCQSFDSWENVFERFLK